MALQCSSWSDLPQEILEFIFDCSKNLIDILRCGAACRSWLPIALKFLRQCFILLGKDKDGIPVLRNFFTNDFRKIQVPEANKKWIYSYSDGWLVRVDCENPHRMQLLNVFSGTQIDLPPFTPITPSDSTIGLKLLLSKSSLDSDCTVFLLGDSFSGSTEIISWKPGDGKWTILKTTYRKVYDAILYKGKLYATVSDSTHRNFLITCNYKLEVEAKVSIPETQEKYRDGGLFLVKSLNGDCFLVGDRIVGTYCGKSIEMFEFDVGTKEFRKVKDLGGCTLFLGRNNFLAKAEKFDANCIYYFEIWTVRDYYSYSIIPVP